MATFLGVIDYEKKILFFLLLSNALKPCCSIKWSNIFELAFKLQCFFRLYALDTRLYTYTRKKTVAQINLNLDNSMLVDAKNEI